MISALISSTAKIQELNLTDTVTCLKNKLPCMSYDLVCGKNKTWNFRQALSYIRYSLTIGVTNSSRLLEIIWTVANTLLEEENVEMILKVVKPYCPNPSKYCSIGSKQKREVFSEQNFIAAHLIWMKALFDFQVRSKRAFDPEEMMSLFRKITCHPDIFGSIAQYYSTKQPDLHFSTIWVMQQASKIWCCLALHLKELYHST